MKKRGGRILCGKQAQITLFLIIALVIIGGAITYIVLAKQKFKTDPMEEAKRNAEQLARSDSIRIYVESCLEQATKEAVFLAGRQGGYLYDYQYEGGIFFLGPGGQVCSSFPPGTCSPGAYIIPYETVEDTIDNVSYLIKSTPNLFFPTYPYRGYLRTKDQPDTFGIATGGEKKGNPLELCDLEGPNARDTEGAKHTCFNSYSSVGKSIQAFMGSYIAEKVQKCSNFSRLELTKGVEVVAENASAEVMFGDTDLIATVHYKLMIKLSAKQSVSTISDYSYHMGDMRFKEIYELAYYLIKEDTTNIFFDKTSELDLKTLAACTDPAGGTLKTFCLKEGMSVSRVPNPCSECPTNRYADIIQITDLYSTIEGEPYIFQFAVANRPPALDNINSEIIDTTHYYRYLSTLGKAAPYVYWKKRLVSGDDSSYNIIVGKNDILEIYPYGIDPDENTLTYRYVPLEGDSAASEKLEASELFRSTGRDSAIDASSLGVGVHYVRITVADEEGLSDWQDLKIMVCDTDITDPLPEHACS